MLRYLLQADSKDLDIEYNITKELLKNNKYIFEHKNVDLQTMLNIADKTDIPIGDINFVTEYLRKFHGIEKENPIEVPEYLRTDEFLKRLYAIVKWDQIPRQSKYFLKDVSQLKKFGRVVDTTYMNIDELFNYVPRSNLDSTLVLDKSHLFLVSNLFKIQSEYRVYVCQGEIENISCYNGDCTILPDMNLIKKAVYLINYNEKWLRSYTLDFMVGPEGTALIEVHNFTSVGLYSNQWGTNLIMLIGMV
jgi:hypothetical protein